MAIKKSMLSPAITSQAKRLNAQILKMNEQSSDLIRTCLNEREMPKRVVSLIDQVCGLNSEHVHVLKELSCL
ncbi:MAG: hypothetical protein WBB37_07380 [bacterium]